MSWFTEYKKSLKMSEVEEFVDLIIYRPLAFLLIKLIYNTRITPDQLTLAAIVMGLIGGLFYSFGLQPSSNIGAVFFILFIILDCSDGQLARLKKNGSSMGRLLDGIADYIVVSAIYIAIAIGYSQKDGQPLFILGLLGLSGVSIIIQDMLVDFYRTRFLDIINKRKNTFSEGIDAYREEYLLLKEQKGKWIEKSVIGIYLVYSKFQKNLIGKKKKPELPNISSEEYYRKNRFLIRLWVFMGPSIVRTTLIVCSLFSRYDIYFWITIVGLNIYALIIWLIQHKVDKSYTTQLS